VCVKARLKGRHNGVLYLSTVSLVSYYVTDFGDIHAYLLVSFQESIAHFEGQSTCLSASRARTSIYI